MELDETLLMMKWLRCVKYKASSNCKIKIMENDGLTGISKSNEALTQTRGDVNSPAAGVNV
jgi:hypothetical protein